jgi:hypothetical protein
MKPHINLGAYGWRHAHWLDTFYPPDLPQDWQLTYYSNEFNAVMVPADYWHTDTGPDYADWLDNVHPGFQFFVECHARMLDQISSAVLGEYLENLRPQLSALVFLDDRQQMPEAVKDQFAALIEILEVDVFGQVSLPGLKKKAVWQVDKPQSSNFAWLENDLRDLKEARKIIENFVAVSHDDRPMSSQAAVIVHHPHLQAGDLSKFRSLIEIMGY